MTNKNGSAVPGSTRSPRRSSFVLYLVKNRLAPVYAGVGQIESPRWSPIQPPPQSRMVTASHWTGMCLRRPPSTCTTRHAPEASLHSSRKRSKGVRRNPSSPGGRKWDLPTRCGERSEAVLLYLNTQELNRHQIVGYSRSVPLDVVDAPAQDVASCTDANGATR